MIAANELRIGNLVEYNGEFKTVAELFNASNNTQWNPIILTEDWLLKFGFEKEISSYAISLNVSGSFIEGVFGFFVNGNPFRIIAAVRFVHEFQNAISVFTGEELTIKE